MVKKIVFSLSMLLSVCVLAAQSRIENKLYTINGVPISANTQIDPTDFHSKLLDSIIVDQINFLLSERDCEQLQWRALLARVANEQSEYMAMMADEDPSAKLKEPVTIRLQNYGGSNNAEELVAKLNVMKNKSALTYFKMADEFVFRWMSNSRSAALFESVNYQYIGVASNIDLVGKRVFVSVVLGNFKSFNEGVRNRDQLRVPYSVKNNGLEGYDHEVCKRINRMNNLYEIYDAMVVEGREVFVEFDNSKMLQKLLRSKTDALALDILQKEQYSCQYERNIIDYNRFNRGVLTKPYKSKKILKKNIADKTNNSKAFKAKIADLPENINLDSSELNLLVIQDGAVCTSIPKTFIHTIKGTYKNNVRLLADTIMINSRFTYKPIPDTAYLTFVVPFKGNKADYNVADIEPFLEALEQPDFTILDLDITAYSSVEGNDSINRNLQQRRAESIVKALEKRQMDSIQKIIITDYNWGDFVEDISKTKYKHFARLTVEQVQDSIIKNNLTKELEPILQKHRYARINMRIIYDIDGENERPFVVRKFNEACDSTDRILALSIQKFVMKRVVSKKYPLSVLDEMKIPDLPDFAGLAMNDMWLRYKMGQFKERDLKERIGVLAENNPYNEYIVFNDLLMRVNYPDGLYRDLGPRLQQSIDRLYYTTLKKETIDRLNIRLQLKTIDEVDSLTHIRATKIACVERIKQIVDIKTESLANSIRLAELFLDNKDYLLTIKTLEPWVSVTDNIEVLLTYVSLCSLFENLMHTSSFNDAMEQIRRLDPHKYCSLLNGEADGFSLRIFENDLIKANYCKHCSQSVGN